MMDRSPRFNIPSTVEIGPLVLEEKIFEGFYHTWAWHPSASYKQIFISLYLKPYIQNFINTVPVVSEESKF